MYMINHIYLTSIFYISITVEQCLFLLNVSIGNTLATLQQPANTPPVVSNAVVCTKLGNALKVKELLRNAATVDDSKFLTMPRFLSTNGPQNQNKKHFSKTTTTSHYD